MRRRRLMHAREFQDHAAVNVILAPVDWCS